MKNQESSLTHGHGGKRNGAGRKKGVPDTVVRLPQQPVESKAAFLEYALESAVEAFETLKHIMRHGESHEVQLKAATQILDRSLGKAPQHVDLAAVNHSQIVYRSAEEIHQALLDRGVPPTLLNITAFNFAEDQHESTDEIDAS
jgi:hypothetical protein